MKHHNAAQSTTHSTSQSKAKTSLTELPFAQYASMNVSNGYALAFANGSVDEQALRLGDERMLPTQRQALATGIAGIQGNRHLQNVMATPDLNLAARPSTGQVILQNIVARSVRTVAETQARAPRTGSWSTLNDADYTFVRNAIRRGDPRAAINRVIRALNPNRDYLRRVRLDYTVPISGDGDAEAFVEVGPDCDSYSATDHWQHHNRDEILVYVRLNPSVFTDYSLPERAIRLHNTLAHELVHVQQFVDGGIDSHTRFRREGNREYLTMASAGEATLIGSLQEIDAISAEIENLASTRLTETELIRHTVNYLWENYTEYRREMQGRVDSAIASRVYLNIQRGRQALYAFIDSEPGYRAVRRTLRSSRGALSARQIIDSWLYMCPRDFNESLIRSHVTDSNAIAEAARSSSAETALRGNLPTIIQNITSPSGP